MAERDSLVDEWKELYSKTLPALAKARDAAQPKWPVSLDHCFARIILDNTVGEGSQQWDKVISKPAVKHMNEFQLKNAIDLGHRIQKGEIDLCDLDEISLLCRGKNEGKYSKKEQPAKRKTAVENDGSNPSPHKKQKTGKEQSTLSFVKSTPTEGKPTDATADGLSQEEFIDTLELIRSHASLTPYRRRLYTVLLSVPRGRHTTYAAMSDYLESSARAVGNGIRNNPFAPTVPCHRVLAADGSIGGFHGDWGKEGKYANDKLKLLREEGVRFDGKGKVVGSPFRKFHEFEHLIEEKAADA